MGVGCRKNHQRPSACQNSLGIEPFFELAFEVGHLAVPSPDDPAPALGRVNRGRGGSEPAARESPFERLLAERLLHAGERWLRARWK